MIGRESELGYWLDPKCWGQGLMREAAQAVLGAHFTSPAAAPVPSGYMLGNARSAGLLHGLGFSPFGAVVQRKNTAQDALVDIRQMILTPEQWHCLNPMGITTPRVTLRPLRPTDAPDLARIAGNDAVAPMLASVTSPWPETDVLQWIEQSRWRGRLGFKLGVCLPVARLLARWVWAERPKVLHISWRHRFGGGG
jgi:RimJ/RimL family protein N-acetyltransferase